MTRLTAKWLHNDDCLLFDLNVDKYGVKTVIHLLNDR